MRFAVDPLNIENYSNLLNKFKKQFPEINIFTNIMYANNWFKDDKEITFMIKTPKTSQVIFHLLIVVKYLNARNIFF